MRYLLFLLLITAFVGCQPQLRKNAAVEINKFADPEIRRIYTLQDERKTTNLLPYLKHQNATYRREAALAFASVQDKSALLGLADLLVDKETLVRRTAAYALGQIGDVSAETSLMQQASRETDAAVQAEILEALGKCASQKGLNFLIDFTPANAVVKAGQAWGLYRTNAKALLYEAAVPKVVSLLTADNSAPVRLGAAHFLARTPKLNLTAHQAAITAVAQADKSPEVRMAAALALAKVNPNQVTGTLLNLAQNDPDYRVRINAMKALTTADYNQVKTVILSNLNHQNINTALAAADFLLTQAPPEDANLLLTKANTITNWRVRATLLASALKLHLDKKAVRTAIQQRYQQENNIYEKGALLAALGQDADAYAFLQKETFSGASPILASYGMQALADIRQRKTFPVNLNNAFAQIFKQAIASNDVAVIGIAAGVLQKPELNFKETYPDFSFLQIARDKLELPRDMETYQELDKTIRYFKDQPAAPAPQNPYTHPINWTLIQSLPANQLVQLTTAKGNITLQLLVEEAPGSVANFVQLAQQGFFNKLNFHRVVPNFVVQGGDPRGDGWGGVDYAIRSELANLRYSEGYVGMASAGKDTESCQWFITHSPTPHLDGRYTIFAKVTAGMEVVHQLEVGDKIEAVVLMK